MTQYGVLSSWAALQAGFSIPVESIEAVTNWLLHTQDPSGQFGYQGTESKDATLVAQREMRPSMTVAGLGSLYICSTMLGIAQKTEKRRDDLPPALQRDQGQGKQQGKAEVADRSEIGPCGNRPDGPMAQGELYD